LQPYNVKTTKRNLIERMKHREAAEQSSTSNLSPETLEHMAQNKRLVDSGQLPRFVDNTADSSNPELEKQAKRVYEFSHMLGNRKSRNEY
jgi:hypothetical protein